MLYFNSTNGFCYKYYSRPENHFINSSSCLTTCHSVNILHTPLEGYKNNFGRVGRQDEQRINMI